MSGWPPQQEHGGATQAPGFATALRGGAPRRARRPRDADQPGRWRRLVPTRDALVDAAFAAVLVTIALVADGLITWSTYPRSAAMYGLTRVSSYSVSSRARSAATSGLNSPVSAACACNSLRYNTFTAPADPITAIWAVGQARLTSAPRCLEPITSYAPP